MWQVLCAGRFARQKRLLRYDLLSEGNALLRRFISLIQWSSRMVSARSGGIQLSQAWFSNGRILWNCSKYCREKNRSCRLVELGSNRNNFIIRCVVAPAAIGKLTFMRDMALRLLQHSVRQGVCILMHRKKSVVCLATRHGMSASRRVLAAGRWPNETLYKVGLGVREV